MKNNIIALLTTLCLITISINAYENSFYNNTNTPVAIAIQYTGNDTDEPLYAHFVKPGSLDSFEPGEKDIPEIKWAFCLDNIYYVENPTQEQRARNFEKAPWKKIPITWITEKSTTKRPSKKQRLKTGSLQDPKKSIATPQEKSLCKDRHFDIIRNKNGKITITASLND